MKINKLLTSAIATYMNAQFSEAINHQIPSDCKGVHDALLHIIAFDSPLLFTSEVIHTDNISSTHTPDFFILERDSTLTIIRNKDGILTDDEGKQINLEKGDEYTIFFIKRTIKQTTASEIMTSLIKQTPLVSFFMIFLVVFVLASPVYSNIFNSRLVHASSISPLLAVSFVFFIIFVLEFALKEIVMNNVNSKIENQSKQAEMVFFELATNSISKDTITNWKTASDSVTSLWRGFGQIFLDTTTVLLIIVTLGFELGMYAVFPISTYILLFIISIRFKIKSYKEILAMNSMKDQKTTYLINMTGSNPFFKFVDKEMIRDKWRRMTNSNANFSLNILNHEEFHNGVLKLYASTSIAMIFIASFCAIRNGSCEQSSIIALMLLNGRCSAALNSLINKTYSSVINYSKIKSSLEALSSETISKNIADQYGIYLKPTARHSITIKNISKNKGDTDETILSINKTVVMTSGECWCITGAAGSGKTTLLNIISGKIDSDSGSVLIDGINIKDYSPSLFCNNIAYYSISDAMIGDTLSFNLSLKYGTDIEPAIENLMYFGCDYAVTKQNLFESSARELKISNGQLQKINMVRSLGVSPKIIIMDEPCSNLSNPEARLFIQKLKERYKESIIIIATHNPIIRNISDKIWDIETNEFLQK